MTPALRRELDAARAARGLPPYAEPPKRRAPAAPMTYERHLSPAQRRVPCDTCGRAMTTKRAEPPYTCAACRSAAVDRLPAKVEARVVEASWAGNGPAAIAEMLGLDRDMVRRTVERSRQKRVQGRQQANTRRKGEG